MFTATYKRAAVYKDSRQCACLDDVHLVTRQHSGLQGRPSTAHWNR